MVTKLALPAIPTLHENSFLSRIFTLSLPPGISRKIAAYAEAN
jgi:hypothetical protein